MKSEELKDWIRIICNNTLDGCKGCPLFPHVEAAIKAYRNGMDATQKTPETRREILQAAERCVCGDRDQDYGAPEDSFALIAELWEPIIKARCVGPGVDVDLDAVTVALCMAELKIARAATNETHMDSWVDLAGYAACGGEIARHDKA